MRWVPRRSEHRDNDTCDSDVHRRGLQKGNSWYVAGAWQRAANASYAQAPILRCVVLWTMQNALRVQHRALVARGNTLAHQTPCAKAQSRLAEQAGAKV